MQLSLVFLAAAGLLPAAAAFNCRIGQYGECYYYQGSSTRLSRCAITCGWTWRGVSKCRCPSHYPNKDSWDYAHKHDCINWDRYESRNKCQDPNSLRRDGLPGPGGGPEVSGLDDRDLWEPEERDLAGRQEHESLEFQDHDLPLSVLDGLSSED